MPIRASLLLTATLMAGPAMAQSYASGPERVHLIELYTSQGCSSCPPADHWLAQWRARGELWRRLVPLALHVDYWDYLGWRDPFAAPEHSDRQRRYHRERALGAVYTPGFVFDGREWRRFSGGRLPQFDRDRVGELRVSLDGDLAAIEFVPVGELRRARAYLAVLGFGLRTEVVAGENRGRTLRHEFVVLGLTEAPMVTAEHGFSARLPVPEPRREAPRLGIAAWVTDGDRLAPLQALGGWLER